MVNRKNTQSAANAPYDHVNPEVFKATPQITSNTSYDFRGKQMSAFGGIFLFGSLIEKLDIYRLLDQHLTVSRKTIIPPNKLLVAMVILIILGFERLQHIIHIASDSMILGFLGIPKLPIQSTLWRFLNRSLHKHNERQLQNFQHDLRNRVWALANVKPRRIHINTDTTSSIAYGRQDGAKVGYCPGKRGAKCFRPLLSSVSETGEIIMAQQRSGDRVGGIELAKHLKRCIKQLPQEVEKIWRADSEFYCGEAIRVCESEGVHYVVSVRKTAPVQDLIGKCDWSKSSICDGIGEFLYTPSGWKKPYRFVVARYRKEQDEQTDLFEDAKYKYRVFVTDLKFSAQNVVIEYDGRAGIENLIEEAKNQVAFAKIPGKNFIASSLFLQIVTIAFNLNRYLQIFGRNESATYHNEEMRTIRQTGMYISARVTEHSRRTHIHFGSEYPRQNWFNTIMNRLKTVGTDMKELLPVIPTPFRGVSHA